MKDSISVFSEPGLLLCLAAIFAILFMVVRRVLKDISFFQGKTVSVVAMCVSILSMIGLYHFLVGGGDNNEQSVNLRFILLPYATLGLAILCLLLLRFVAWLFRSETGKRYSKEISRITGIRNLFKSLYISSGKRNEKTSIKQ